MKDLALNEKKQVGLEERRKHANGKMKKLKKSSQDVCFHQDSIVMTA